LVEPLGIVEVIQWIFMIPLISSEALENNMAYIRVGNMLSILDN
jgi:hypothetical protein